MTAPDPDPALKITYNRVPATTVALAAARHRVTVKHMATTLTRLGIRPIPSVADPTEPARIDGRTLLYPSAAIDRAIQARPGRGANLRGHG